jgi:hypothetical protein
MSRMVRLFAKQELRDVGLFSAAMKTSMYSMYFLSADVVVSRFMSRSEVENY